MNVQRTMAAAAALGWVGVGAYGVWQMAGQEAGDSWQRPYTLFTISLALALGATTAFARSHVRPDAATPLRVVSGVIGVLTFASAAVAWAMPLWATLLVVGTVTVAIGASPHDRAGLAVLGAAPVVGLVALFVARAAQLGRVDGYGDYPAAFGVGNSTIAAGCLLGVGVLLRRDQRAAPQRSRGRAGAAGSTA